MLLELSLEGNKSCLLEEDGVNLVLNTVLCLVINSNLVCYEKWPDEI